MLKLRQRLALWLIDEITHAYLARVLCPNGVFPNGL